MSELRLLEPSEFLGLPPKSAWDFKDLERLHAAIGEKSALQEALPGLACRKGCHHCCRRIPSLLPVEFAYLSSIAASGGDSSLRSELHPGEALCGLLDDQGACRLYERRPVVCRTHGLLILSEAGLDHCPWNFQELEEIDESLPFSLESLHETSLRVNLAFLQRSYPDAWRSLAAVRVRFQS
ncbi:MAG: YkgJ family cysteine cluster protein [Fibrobacteres bacterium]|nr:YkgJ family cysteine cluster protein [Fibrobacterota bacterium]